MYVFTTAATPVKNIYSKVWHCRNVICNNFAYYQQELFKILYSDTDSGVLKDASKQPGQ